MSCIEWNKRNKGICDHIKENGLITGLAKIDIFFQNRHLLNSSTAYTKYEHFTKLCFHTMTLNSRPFAIIAFLMFKKTTHSGFVARRCLSISGYYSIAYVQANLRYIICTKPLFSPSVSSSRYVFRTKNPQPERRNQLVL